MFIEVWSFAPIPFCGKSHGNFKSHHLVKPVLIQLFLKFLPLKPVSSSSMFCSVLIMLCSFLIAFGCQHIFRHFFCFGVLFITFAIDTDLSFKFLVFVFALCERLFLVVIMINCSHSQRQIRVRVDMPMGELVWQQGSCASCLTWCQSSWWPLKSNDCWATQAAF